MMPRHMKSPLGGIYPSDDTMQKVLVIMITMSETLTRQHEFIIAQSENKSEAMNHFPAF
jgi:hypothetical protein